MDIENYTFTKNIVLMTEKGFQPLLKIKEKEKGL
jgi:hypothetical protein